jgi:formylglycine-generating enzyme required for sulfatase activity
MPSFPRVPLLLAVSFVCASVAADQPATIAGITDQKPESGIFVEVDGKFMVPYTAKIPGTDVTFEMVPVPGGSFLLGSPDDEEDRQDYEGPQIKVNVAPMWVGKHEVTWAEYDQFRALYQVFTNFEFDSIRKVTDQNKVDSITTPTPLHEPTHTFEYGHEPKQPAVTMTQYAAQQYTKWLSAITGGQYRLPTEAEWEYACRAGTKTAYYWGDDPDDAEQHAWYFDNARDGQKEVGLKPANPFGLHDMHGNVAEWTVNSATDDYQWLAKQQPVDALEAVVWPTETASEAVMRGGTWESFEDELRSAAKLISEDDEWKSEDPNYPRSPWWFTSDPARGVGFRLFRSYQDLHESRIRKFWDNIAEDARFDVESRLDGGKGKRGLVDKDLPEAIGKLEASKN